MSDKPHGSHENPLSQLWMAMSGASTGHHEETPGLDNKSVAVGHEPDRFGIGGIVAVPIAVILTLVVTYVIVTMLMRYVAVGSSDPIASNDVNLGDRLTRIDSTGGKAAAGVPALPSGEPRLDGLPKLDTRINGKEVAPYLMSFRRTPTGNSPEIYPEDLRAEIYVDAQTQKQPLADPPEKLTDTHARLPISTVLHLLAHDLPKWKAEKDKLEHKGKLEAADAKRLEEVTKLIAQFERFSPVSATPLDPHTKPTERAKIGNGGQTRKASDTPAKPSTH